jgi:predicted aspartyl protease
MAYTETRRRRIAEEKAKRRAEAESPLLEFSLSPAVLLHIGPVIVTDLGITESHETALRAANLPVPQKVRCKFLIDTGADGCVVKHDIAEKAGLKLINAGVPIHGVGVDTTGRIYMGRIWFVVESRTAPGILLNMTVEAQILSGTLQSSQQIDGLIGRNVLERFDFRYNGRTGKFSLRYLI